MALYTFVGIFCSFIAVDITKFLISRKASGFLYLLNLLAVASLSIILANLLGFIWLMIYSELFITVWFPELYHFGQMFIAFFGSSIWMSIFFVPLFHYMHIKNKVQYKKWIYSAFLIIIIAIPLMTVVQNDKSEEDNLTPANNNLPKDDFNKDYMCHTGLEGIYLFLMVSPDSVSATQYIYIEPSIMGKTIKRWDSLATLKDKFRLKKNNQNEIKYLSASNAEQESSLKLEHIKENIFYEFNNVFMQTSGRCVMVDMDAETVNRKADYERLGFRDLYLLDSDAKYFEIAKFLKSQGLVNQ